MRRGVGPRGKRRLTSQKRRLAGLLLFLALFVPSANGQDVEALGRHHGTRPPASYYDLMSARPDAFQFGGRRFRPPTAGGGVLDPFFDGEGSYRAVSGSYRFPLLLLRYSDSPAEMFTVEDVDKEFFEGPNSRYATISEYYAEVSGGRVSLVGETLPWTVSDLTQSTVTGGVSGLGGNSRVGSFIMDGLGRLDSLGVDWGTYDNDGPDGIPNSGDDDGFVDVLAVMHPTEGAECSGERNSDRIWSHRWTLSGSTRRSFVTSSPSASVSSDSATILVDNYTIQPLLACGGEDGMELNQIGVFAHELGHGFGLPDLYAVGSGEHAGVGRWGLMASGSWGCDGRTPARPCHMMAWSKAVLGWADVEVLGPDRVHGQVSLDPVVTSKRVLRIDGQDFDDTYLLLENRRRIGFDETLFGEGLLVWQIDGGTVTSRWPSNTVNADQSRMGVWLRQADGRNDLGTSNRGRGDAGDPYPGAAENGVFHASSLPSSRNANGKPLGITITDIVSAGDASLFHVQTGFSQVTVGTVNGGPGAVIRLNGVTIESGTSFSSAPYELHLLEASGGVTLEPGVRSGFSGWEDSASPTGASPTGASPTEASPTEASPTEASPTEASPIRGFLTGRNDTVLVASFGLREVQVDVDFSGPVAGIIPGSLRTRPGNERGWVPEGATAVITAVPNVGFGFYRWEGGLEGFPNPVTFEASGPISAKAVFDVIFSAERKSPVVGFSAGTGSQSILLLTENGNQPVTWGVAEGQLPRGIRLLSDGWLRGAPLETGTFVTTLVAVDSVGLEASLSLVLQVAEPSFDLAALLSPLVGTGDGLSLGARDYLDEVGNDNGAYDLGDFRAYILSGGRVLKNNVRETPRPLPSTPESVPAPPDGNEGVSR